MVPLCVFKNQYGIKKCRFLEKVQISHNSKKVQISEKSADFRIRPFLESLKAVTHREPVHRVARSVFHITHYNVLHTHLLAGSLGRFKDALTSQKKVQISKKNADFQKKCRFPKKVQIPKISKSST